MKQRVRTCSVYGGNVYGYRGTWYSILPPLPDECAGCGATSASDVIKMYPRPGRISGFKTKINVATNHSRWPW